MFPFVCPYFFTPVLQQLVMVVMALQPAWMQYNSLMEEDEPLLR